MTCREIADFLMDYVSGELPAGVREQFEQHLRVCPNCRAYIATYQASIVLAGRAFAVPDADARTEVPDDLVSAIMDTLRTSGHSHG